MFGFRTSQQQGTRTARIQKLGLFSTLKPKELRVIDALLQERRYLAGEVIFDEGEEGQALYIVFSGKVLICRPGAGDPGRIADVLEGSMFGELALLDGSPRSAQARAADDCVLGVLSRADFTGLTETHAIVASKVSLQLARALGQKLREHYLAMDARPL